MLPSGDARFINGVPITDSAVDSAALVYSLTAGGYVHEIVTTGGHGSSHESGGSDQVDGDILDIDWNPANTTPATVGGYSTSVDHLTSHLKGIDVAIGTLNSHNHDADYADIAHDHDSDYSAIGHDHDADYADISHDHDSDYSALTHAADHIEGGSDEVDGDTLSITWAPSGYTRATAVGYTTATTELTSHLKGIDDNLVTLNAHDHDADYAGLLHDHASYYADIDGDVLWVSWTPSNYTPTAVDTYTTNTEELTSHLKGIDTALATVTSHASRHEDGGADEIGTLAAGIEVSGEITLFSVITPSNPGAGYNKLYFKSNNRLYRLDSSGNENEVGAAAAAAHAADHITSGSDEIDGDKLDIDWNPTNYTPATVVSYSDSADNLTSHLKGIDDQLGILGGGAHASGHETGGADEIDGDHIDIDWEPTNSTPAIVAGYSNHVDNLTSHLKGIDAAIGALGAGFGIEEITAGAALSEFDVVYADSGDSGEYKKAQADGTAAEADAVGIVVESGGISDTANGDVRFIGPVTNGSWTWTPGATLYLSATAGGLTETAPTTVGQYVKPLGHAITATKVWFAPMTGWQVV